MTIARSFAFRVLVALASLVAPLRGDEPAKFRTDGGADESLPWYQLVDGEFPPEGSAHAISGELIHVDHLERRFALRVDRNDDQDAGHLDLSIEAAMLPYGAIYYHGAPAALQDVPLGTHLHGLFYVRPAAEKGPPKAGPFRRVSPDAIFTRCLQLEDDFSHRVRKNQLWKIDAVDLAAQKLTATLQENGAPLGGPTLFDLRSYTRVHVGDRVARVDALRPGQTVALNITWATIYGPGRLLDVWIDEASSKLATELQLERHRNHIRERGLPGWVTAVDDEAQIVTITFFGGVDPSLFDELTRVDPEPFGWPYSVPEDDPLAPKGGIAVSMDSLMTYDPVNDRKGGNILHIGKIPVQPGSSGVQIKVKCGMLLEGYRPKRVVRFYPAGWKVEALPREEQFHGRE